MPEYDVLNKDTIKIWIMPCLSVAKRGFTSKFDLPGIVNAILYRLKSGRMPVAVSPTGSPFQRGNHRFSGEPPSWNTVFQHYRKRCRKDEWRKAYANVLSRNKEAIDLSLSHIDCSHTPALRGGECVEYQGRKKRKTTNALYFTDNRGLPLAMAIFQAGNNADLHEIKERVDEIAWQLKEADIPVYGLFCDLDAGFDGHDLRVALDSHGIISNLCPNRMNGGQPSEERLFD